MGNGSYAGDITIGSLHSGKFDYSSSAGLIASGIISGQGILQASGTGVFEPTATNTYTGGTIIDGGVIKASHANSLGATPVVTSSSGRFETGSITLPSLRINGNVTLQSGITTTGSQY